MEPDPVVAVIPLKALGAAKGRLAGALPPGDRRALVLSMFDHVATTARQAAGVTRVLVVTADPTAAGRARELRLEVVQDPGGGLNAAVAAADEALPASATSLVLAADLPRVSAAEVDRVIDLGGRTPSVVVASTHDGGTGALLRRPGRIIGPRYGPGSAAEHLSAAARAGVRTVHVRLPGLAHDVDRPSDLAQVPHLSRCG